MIDTGMPSPFSILAKDSSSGARAGQLQLLATPGLYTELTKGAIPHLTRDNLGPEIPALKHAGVGDLLSGPAPIISILPSSPHPLHAFFGLPPATPLSISLTSPSSLALPPTCSDTEPGITSSQGHGRLPLSAYVDAVRRIQPDIVWAPADARSGLGGNRGERRGADRTLSWLKDFASALEVEPTAPAPALWVELMGGLTARARTAFSSSLLDNSLDQHVSGYVLPLPSLRTRFATLKEGAPSSSPAAFISIVPDLLSASLKGLPDAKARIAPGTLSPHEILTLVECGVDLFDLSLAEAATEAGVALTFDFALPPSSSSDPASASSASTDSIGLNLYDARYRLDLEPIPSLPGTRSLASHPRYPDAPLLHSPGTSGLTPEEGRDEPPFSKAYIHHLLKTHEILASVLLQSHNIAHLSRLFEIIRESLLSSPPTFAARAAAFRARYPDERATEALFAQGWVARRKVEGMRGKGSMGKDRSS